MTYTVSRDPKSWAVDWGMVYVVDGMRHVQVRYTTRGERRMVFVAREGWVPTEGMLREAEEEIGYLEERKGLYSEPQRRHPNGAYVED